MKIIIKGLLIFVKKGAFYIHVSVINENADTAFPLQVLLYGNIEGNSLEKPSLLKQTNKIKKLF